MMQYLRRMASYNQWMNRKLYASVRKLSDQEISKDRAQVTSLLFLAGVDPGVTDLLTKLVEEK